MKPGTLNKTLLVCALLALLGSAALNRKLTDERVSRADSAELQGGTPLVTFVTVVLGGFRGMIADVLWLRATVLQDEGRFFELAQLADWITQLESQSPEIWAFHAWNMAYNISVLMGNDDDRWRWVSEGMHLLRDRAIAINPNEAVLYAELAWLYQQKIGSTVDRSHVHYKRTWAGALEPLLATPDEDARAAGLKAYNLDLVRMRDVNARFGPLDWRVPETHAVYWAWQGRDKRGPAGRLRCERILYQSMATLFFRGRLPVRLPPAGFPSRARPDLFDRVCATFIASMTVYPGDDNIRDAFHGFLQGAVLLLDACGNPQQSRRAFDMLRSRVDGMDAVSLDAFVRTFDLDTLAVGVRMSILQERGLAHKHEPETRTE